MYKKAFFGMLFFFILVLWTYALELVQGEELINACPGKQQLFRFNIKRKAKVAEDVFDNIETFFWDSLAANPGVFITRTTGLLDICTIETLSLSYKSVKDASVLANSGAKIRLKDQKQKDSKSSVRTTLYIYVAVYGSPGLTAIKTKQVSDHLVEVLGLQDKITITTTLEKAPINLKSVVASVSATGSKASTSTLAGLPPRTHTFQAYASSPTFKDYTPVIIADTEFASEVPYDLTALTDGSVLKLSTCSISNVYQSPRKSGQWTALTGLNAKNLFVLKQTSSSTWRLMLQLSKTSTYYRLRYQTNMAPSGGIQGMLSTLGLNFGKRRQLPAENTQSFGNLTIPSISLDGGGASIQNFASNDFTFDYAIVFSCKPAKKTTTTVKKGLKTPPTAATPQTMRMDVTLVPKIQRDKQVSSALVCLPGVSDGIKTVDIGVPKQATCPSFPTRPTSLILDDETFDGLHPEEKDWVSKRLQKTATKAAAFIQANLPTGVLASGASVDENRAGLKIGISVSGGGKRSFFNGAGVVSGLTNAGIVDFTTWFTGASGGAWLVGGLVASSLGKAGLVDPVTYVNDRLADLTKPVFDGTFKANEIFTNFGSNMLSVSLPVAPFNPGTGDANDKILCQSEIKIQSPTVSPNQAQGPMLAEYYSKAIGYQFLSKVDGGYGITMSGLGKDPLLANQQAPLPIIQIQQNNGAGFDNDAFRLVEVSPFDMTIQNAGLHVSYPTRFFGTTPSDSQKRCTTQVDQLSYIMGLSSWAFPVANEIQKGAIKSLVCGVDGGCCQPVPQYSPFQGYSGPSRSVAPDVFSNTETRWLDGGLKLNNPLWPLITRTRQADIVMVIDSAGASEDPPVSVQPPAQCTSDSSINQCPSGKFYGSAPSCCNICDALGDLSCWPTTDPNVNDLFDLKTFGPNTLPSKWPGGSNVAASVSKVTFFGCDESGKTAIVYFPNRIVSSGKGGFQSLRGVLDLNDVYGIKGNQRITAQDAKDILKNGQDQLPSSFKTCLSCLMYATMNDRSTFWSNNPGCNSCFEEYCYNP